MQNIKLIFHLVSQCSNNKFLFELKTLKWKHVKKQTVFSKHEIMNRILYSLLAYFYCNPNRAIAVRNCNCKIG